MWRYIILTGNEFSKSEYVDNLLNEFLNDIDSKSNDKLLSEIRNIVSYSFDAGRSELKKDLPKGEYAKSKEVTDIIPENFIYSKECSDIIVFLVNSIMSNTTNNKLNIDFKKSFAKDVLAAMRTVYSLAVANCFEILNDDYKLKIFIENRERILDDKKFD